MPSGGPPTTCRSAADRLAYLGVAVDPRANTSAGAEPDRRISPADAALTKVVVAPREDLEIARQTRAAVSRASI